MLDVDAMAGAVFESVKTYLDTKMAPVLARLAEMEARPVAKDGDPGKPGLDGKDADPAEIAALVDAAVKALPAPQDGVSVTLGDMAPVIEQAVQKAVSALPVAKDGKDGRDGADGKDGVGLAGVLIDRDEALVVTLTDGATKALGRIVGKDGADGLPGKDGRDGINLKGFSTEFDGERTVTFKLTDGETVISEAIELPLPNWRGVFKDSETYKAGQTATFGGSLFIAKRDTNDKPETSDAWGLAVKRGRDGKDGEAKSPNEPKPVRGAFTK